MSKKMIIPREFNETTFVSDLLFSASGHSCTRLLFFLVHSSLWYIFISIPRYCVALIHRSSITLVLLSCISHAAWSFLLLDMFQVSDFLVRVHRYDQDKCASGCI